MMNAQRELVPWYCGENARAKCYGLYICAQESSSEGYRYWWWYIRDETTGTTEYSFDKIDGKFLTCAEAREDTEAAARRIIEARYSALFYHLFQWNPLYH